MATQDDVRRIASRLPGAAESPPSGQFGFSAPNKGKYRGFLWSWSERVQPKKPRVINDGVLAIIVRNLTEKELLLQSDQEVFFTEDHYNGFPAVLVRLDKVPLDVLEDLMVEAWRCKASKDLIAQYEQELGS